MVGLAKLHPVAMIACMKEENNLSELFGRPDTQKDSGVENYSEYVLDKNVLDNDPIGLPDEADIANIKTIFRNYDKAKPGEIPFFIEEAKRIRDAALLAGNKFTATDGSSKGLAANRQVFVLPTGLMRQIEEAYPLMFRNRKHMHWFRKNFSMFNTSDSY